MKNKWRFLLCLKHGQTPQNVAPHVPIGQALEQKNMAHTLKQNPQVLEESAMQVSQAMQHQVRQQWLEADVPNIKSGQH